MESSLLAIVTSKVFLIVNDASSRLTLDTFIFGSAVNKESSEDDARSVVITLKSVTFNAAAGRSPLEIPATAVTPSMSICVVPTLTTLATIGSSVRSPPVVLSVYSIKSFSFTKVPGNAGLLLFTVLTPPTRGLTVAIPTVNLVD